MDSTTSTDNVREDAVSQVLGKDRPGRVRGMGRGATVTKLAFLQTRDSHVKNLEASQAELKSKLESLQNLVSNLASKKRQTDDVSMSDLSNVSKGGVRCQLLDWCSNVEVVVGEGEFCSSEHTYKIGRIPLGRNAAAVLVKSTTVIHASVWRPTPTIFTLNEAVGHKIAWPLDKIILDEDINLSQPTKSVESEQPTDESLGRIKIFQYWSGDDDLIAEGMLLSTDHNELVDGRPLGHGAAVLKVLEVVKPEAYLWRPNPPISLMSDALNETIAWPIDRIQLLDVPANDESTRKSPQSATTPSSTTPSTASSKGAKQKCFLLDIDNTGQRVAIGRVSSTDPAEKVHHVPLGANASKVWVEVSKVEGARVWRANSEVKFIADAVGTTVAWPNDKIIFM
ncbi:Transposase Tnp1/En/Spm-like [Arabidopsis suecica]|uniref:Transposase Tnp1/En/Spm-like n=1 Tax=Arabidopsis suecica TaxID=45249 RepID=A0A8T1XQR6_ARASU|nr:Transposase Tnp1/En/Spm-like [Arabidopsis suecica]